LRDHCERVHSGKNPLPCPICTKPWYNVFELDKHADQEHAKEYCGICHIFTNPIIEGVKMKTACIHQCSYCGMFFEKDKELFSHVTEVHCTPRPVENISLPEVNPRFRTSASVNTQKEKVIVIDGESTIDNQPLIKFPRIIPLEFTLKSPPPAVAVERPTPKFLSKNHPIAPAETSQSKTEAIFIENNLIGSVDLTKNDQKKNETTSATNVGVTQAPQQFIIVPQNIQAIFVRKTNS